MMEYFLVGRHKNTKVVDQYVANMLVSLKLHRLRSKSLIIKFETVLDGECMGLCYGDKNVAQVEIARKSNGDNLSFLEQMQTLAHELVHVRQYIRGELSYNSSGEFQWKKRSAGGYKYENQPWEKEAMGLADVLFTKCFPFHMSLIN